MTKLYHTEVFVPTALLNQAQAVQFRRLAWSRHAQLELIRDQYGMIPASEVPHKFDAAGWTLIELEADGDKITKYVFRRPVDATRSLVIVFRPACCGGATVVTCWTNLNTDMHKTLDRSKYASS